MAVNTTGGLQTAIGAYALDASTTGASQGNVAVGYAAMGANTTGYSSVGVGAYALDAMTDGNCNTACGYIALSACTDAVQNTGVGHGALQKVTSSTNTAVGYNALKEATTGGMNTAVGTAALDAITDGEGNTAVGDLALTATNGSYNTAVGRAAGGNSGTYTGSTCIGYDVCGNDGGTGEIVIGKSKVGVGSGKVTIANGNSYISNPLDTTTTAWTAASDERLKENITTDTAGLSFINDLRPVTYNWKKRKDVTQELSDHYKEGSEEPCLGFEYGKTQHGFIAQEVKEAIDNHPEIKEGFGMWEEYADGIQAIAEGAVVNMLVKAIQELSAKNDALETRIEELEGE